MIAYVPKGDSTMREGGERGERVERERGAEYKKSTLRKLSEKLLKFVQLLKCISLLYFKNILYCYISY